MACDKQSFGCRWVLRPTGWAGANRLFAASFGFIPILSKQLGGTDVTQSLLMSYVLGMFAGS